ncbi:MAG: OadG family protein [Nitrospinae bacterium]|nr:OadG family protein [Nitrospinota bacterium]
MSDFFSSIVVSVLALGVIFAALSTLILLIKVMVFLAPYKAPQKPQKKSQPKSAPAAPAPAGAGPASPEQTAVIQSVLAHHLGRPPGDIHITNVKPL